MLYIVCGSKVCILSVNQKAVRIKQKDNYDFCILFCPSLCFSLDDLEEWGYQIFSLKTLTWLNIWHKKALNKADIKWRE